VLWTKGLWFTTHFLGYGSFQVSGIQGCSANLAMDQIKSLYFIPLIFQEMLKLYGVLRANSPTVGTPDASGHVMQYGAFWAFILPGQRVCRAIFNA